MPGTRNGSMLTVSSFPRRICPHGNCSVTGIPAMPSGCTTSTERSRGRIGTVLWYVPLLDAAPLADHLARDKDHFYQNDEMIEETLWLERLHEMTQEP